MQLFEIYKILNVADQEMSKPDYCTVYRCDNNRNRREVSIKFFTLP